MRWRGVALAEKPWNLEAVLRLFLGVVATFFLGALLAQMAAHFMAGWPKAQSDFWQFAFSAFFLQGPGLVWAAWFLRQQHIGWRDAFGFARQPFGALGWGVLCGIVYVPVAWAEQTGSDQLMKLVHLKAQAQDIVQALQEPGMNGPEKAVFGVVAVVLAPAVEELFFRGILYPAIRRTGHPQAALWVTSILFALAHVNMATFVPLLLFSVVLIYLYETRENLLAPFAAHSLFNAANFFALMHQEQVEHALQQLERALHLA